MTTLGQDHPAIEVRVLGPLEVMRHGGAIPLTAPNVRHLLGLLAVSEGPVSPDVLIDAVWRGEPPRTARAAFHNLVHALRRALGAETLARTASGYELRLPPHARDSERFGRLVREARRRPVHERGTTLRQALSLWRGRALSEFVAEPWALAVTVRLEEERLAALEDLFEVQLELGEHVAVVPELEECVVRHPLRERLWFQLVLALYRSGRQADALAAHRRARELLIGGLGLEPGLTLRELERAILVQDPVLDDATRTLGSTLERAAAILPQEPRERAEYLLAYGAATMSLGEPRQAGSMLRAGVRTARESGETGLELRGRLQLSFVGVFGEGLSMTEHLAAAEEAAATFARLGDDAGLAFALLHQAHMHRDMGRAEWGLALAQRGAERARAAGDEVLTVRCRRMAGHCAAAGPTPVREAIAICDAADAVLPGSRREVQGADARAWLLAQAGRIDEARALTERSLEEFRRQGLLLSLTSGLTLAAFIEHVAGDLDRVVLIYRTAYDLAHAEHMRGEAPAIAGGLAVALARRGEVEDALALVGEARAGAVAGDVLSEVPWRRALALAASYEGRDAEAARLAEEACSRAAQTDWLTFRGETLEDLAAVHMRAGDRRREQKALGEALALYVRKGNVASAGRVREAIARTA